MFGKNEVAEGVCERSAAVEAPSWPDKVLDEILCFSSTFGSGVALMLKLKRKIIDLIFV